ncbi:MAG: DUF2341 domain-containing protein [Bacteroidia bacterium]
MRLRLRNRNRLSNRLKRRLRRIAVASTMAALAGGIFYLYTFIGQISESRASEREALKNPIAEVLEGFSGRKKLSVLENNIPSSETLEDFSMLVSLRLDELKSIQNGGMVSGRDGEDITFTSIDGITILPYQIERFEPSTGKLIAWVKLDSLNQKNKSFYLYYGKSDSHSNESDKTFDKPYEVVWHLNRSFQPNGPLLLAGEYRSIKDEEGRFAAAKDFLAYGGGHAQFQVGSELNFNGDITVSTWIKASKRPFDQVIITNSSKKGGFSLWLDQNNKPIFEIITGKGNIISLEKVDGGTSLEGDTWYKLTGVCSKSEGLISLYVNDKLDRTIETDEFYSAGENITLGATSDGKRGFYNGLLDEIRISSMAFSQSYLTALFKSESDPENFFTIDGQEVFSASPKLAIIKNLESEVKKEHVTVRWQSSNEKNLDFYTLERSLTGDAFVEVARTFGKGNSEEDHSYFIIDPAPVYGTAHYRVRSTSFKGESQVTDIETVNVSMPLANLGINRIDPNPFKEKFDVAFKANAEGDIELKLTSISGTVVYSKSIQPSKETENHFEFNSPSELKPGIYFLSLQQAQETKTVKLIKQL